MKKLKLTRKSNLKKAIEKYPKLGEVLAEKYHLHCFGCFASAFESLEEGALAHGMTNDEIKKMIEELNRIIISE